MFSVKNTFFKKLIIKIILLIKIETFVIPISRYLPKIQPHINKIFCETNVKLAFRKWSTFQIEKETNGY